MKEDNYFWKYKYEPGKIRKNNINRNISVVAKVSIITSFYNSQEFMWQTVNCVLNQTFESWEWIIVDDGSTDSKAIEYLKKLENLDNRIKIYYKENEGLALGRDYAIKYAKTQYILPLDADDLIEPTYIETLFWALETNKEAAWAFTNSVGFGKYKYLSDCKFDSERMKTDNHITATALIRKEKILQVGGYGKARRYVNEDWHLWLRMLANKQFPVQVTFYGFWYRRQNTSLLSAVNNEKSELYTRKMQDLKEEADKIEGKIEAKYFDTSLNSKVELRGLLEEKDIVTLNTGKDVQLYILPYFGTDKKMYKKLKKRAINKDIYIITLQKINHSQYLFRQKYEQFATVYDLTTFLDMQYWGDFINYIVKTRNIKKIYLSNTKYNEDIKNIFKVIELENCKDSNFSYNFNILKYRLSKLFVIRIFRKMTRLIFRKEC